MVSSGIWGFKLAKMLRSGVSVCGVLLQLLLLGIRASSSGVGRISHSMRLVAKGINSEDEVLQPVLRRELVICKTASTFKYFLAKCRQYWLYPSIIILLNHFWLLDGACNV